METTTATDEKRTDRRTIRAARESMTIVPEVPGMYRVYSGSKPSEYVVDVIEGVCECEDYRFNAPEEGCKHIQRVEMEIGEREIPDIPGMTDVEGMIKARANKNEVRTKAMTDGGTVVENTGTTKSGPSITGPHMEPPEISNATTYWRCEDCGGESVREKDLYRTGFHAEGCPGAKEDSE